MSIVVYVGMMLAWMAATRRSPGAALLGIYLPVMLLIPETFRCVVPGLPHLSFNQAAIVPVVVLAWARYARTCKWRLMDFMVLAFALIVSYSDWDARGFTEAKNLIVAMVTSVVMPYLAARLILLKEPLHVQMGRQFVILVFAAALIGFLEFRLAFNPFLWAFGKLFAGQGTGWVTTFRHGLPRVAGPYSHAILAGIMMMMAVLLQRWLERCDHWEPRFRALSGVNVSKARIITVILIVGLLMTIARGPWVGALAAGALGMASRFKDRRKALMVSGGVLASGAAVGYFVLQSYLDIQPGVAMTQSQESAMYRKVLFEQYLDIALTHAWFGWGMTDWPKVRGMESIDNYFLLISLQHGLMATGLLLGMMVLGAAQSLGMALRSPRDSSNAALGFTFAGIFIGVLVSLGTVYFGEQVMPAFFLLLGWAQSACQHLPSHAAPGDAQERDLVLRSGFRRIIA